MIIDQRTFKVRDSNNLKLYIKETGKPKWIVATHGLGEHGLRHQYLIETFSPFYNICLYDLRGHGESEGMRGDITSFTPFVHDLVDLIKFLESSYKMDEFVLYGHSMGGLILSNLIKDYPEVALRAKCLFLSSPAVKGAGLGVPLSYLPLGAHENITKLPLSLKVKGLLNLKKLSHDPQIYENYVRDNKNNLKISLRFFLNIIKTCKYVFSEPLETKKIPLYVAIGTSDVLVDPKACIEFFENNGGRTKLRVVDGGFHELFNETSPFRTPFMEFIKAAFE